MGLTHEKITLDTGHVVGVSTGGTGQPLVFIHGFTVTRKVYTPMLEALAENGFQVYAMDLAGHGDTPSLPKGHTFAEMVNLVTATMQHLGVPSQAVLAGHSLGGRVATTIAASKPGKTKAVVLMSAAAGKEFDEFGTWPKSNQEWFWNWRLAAAACEFTASIVSRPAYANGYLSTLCAAVMSWTPGMLRVAEASMNPPPDTVGLLGTLKRHKVPVAVIHGENDVIVQLASGVSAARLSGGKLTVIPGAFHSWMIADQQKAAAVIAESLEAVA